MCVFFYDFVGFVIVVVYYVVIDEIVIDVDDYIDFFDVFGECEVGC